MPFTPSEWTRVKDVFDRARPLPVRERQAFVAGACAEEPELQEHVEKLLAAHQLASGFLETPPILSDAGPMAGDLDAPAGRIRQGADQRSGLGTAQRAVVGDDLPGEAEVQHISPPAASGPCTPLNSSPLPGIRARDARPRSLRRRQVVDSERNAARLS